MLRPQEAAECIDLRRYPVSGTLSKYVERFWAVRWELPEQTSYESAVIGHPCVNLSFTPGLGAEVQGPRPAVSRHPLTGAGRVFGVKFRPGGFCAFTGRPGEHLADWTAGARAVFGPEVDDLGAIALGGSDEAAAAAAYRFLVERMPPHVDPRYERLLEIVAAILTDRTITKVEQVAERFATTPKSLQRMFRSFVGLGPKWLIRRYRLHDAAELLAAGGEVSLARLAVELGWSDQAHFTHDFKDAIGLPPAEYAEQCASAARELVLDAR